LFPKIHLVWNICFN